MNNIAAIQNFVNSNLNTPLNELISGGGGCNFNTAMDDIVKVLDLVDSGEYVEILTGNEKEEMYL